MKKDTIRVLRKRPGEPWNLGLIQNDLESLQHFVDGYIETVTITSDLVLICNEEGRIRNMEYNTNILNLPIYGPIIIAGVNKDEFDDIPADVKQLIEIGLIKGDVVYVN